jgi:hypothetical protein
MVVLLHLLNSEPIRRLPARSFRDLKGFTCLEDSLGGLANRGSPALRGERPAYPHAIIRVITPERRNAHCAVARAKSTQISRKRSVIDPASRWPYHRVHKPTRAGHEGLLELIFLELWLVKPEPRYDSGSSSQPQTSR